MLALRCIQLRSFKINIEFSEWDDIFQEVMVANAILDRILHHAKVITIAGKSFRLKNYTIQKE